MVIGGVAVVAIERLMEAGHAIDLVRVRAIVEQLAEALDEPERAARFAELVSRAR